MAEVCLVTAALAFKGQQEILPAADATTLIFINDINKQEGENPNVSMCQVSANDFKHLVERVQSMGVVCRFLWPRLKAPISPV